MRRTGNDDENKRIIMDIEVVLKSHDCPFIVQCLGCFITECDVWICMELMATCFDKLLKKSTKPVPEAILGKVTVAVRTCLCNRTSTIQYIFSTFADSKSIIVFKGETRSHTQRH